MADASNNPPADQPVDSAAPVGRPRRRPLTLFRMLGPGRIAGTSDLDPTTVATLAVVGATTVYKLS